MGTCAFLTVKNIAFFLEAGGATVLESTGLTLLLPAQSTVVLAESASLVGSLVEPFGSCAGDIWFVANSKDWVEDIRIVLALQTDVIVVINSFTLCASG
jgi:hypothetical protein